MGNGVPRGLHTVTASITVDDGKAAIEFYKKAFGAEVAMCMLSPGNGAVAHAELKIGDSAIFLNDEFPQSKVHSPRKLGGTTGGLQLYVDDCDAWHKRAVDAGCTNTMSPADMFWGDRMSQVTDTFGHVWGISTNKEQLSEAELARRSEEFWKQLSGGK